MSIKTIKTMPKFGNGHGQGNVSKSKTFEQSFTKAIRKDFFDFWCVFFIEIAVKNQNLGLELSQK